MSECAFHPTIHEEDTKRQKYFVPNLKKSSQQVLRPKTIRTNMSLGLFMGLQTLLLKGIQCLLRLLRQKEDGWNAITSGAIAGGLSYLT